MALSLTSVGRTVQAAPERAWGLLTDTTAWPLWGPSVRRVSCQERIIRQGSHGYIETPVRLRLPFLITEYVHGSYWSWSVAGARATGHRVLHLAPQQCRIVFELPPSWILYRPVCLLALRRLARLLRS